MNDLMNGTKVGRDTFKRVTKGAANSWTLSTGVDTNTQGYTVTDFIPCPSVSRDAGDQATWSVAGGKLFDTYREPLLHLRVAFQLPSTDQTTANAMVVPSVKNSPVGGTAEWPYTPAQPNASGRFVASVWSSAATDQLSIGSADALVNRRYEPLTGINPCPVVGVMFKCRGNVMTVAVCGDSISGGAGLTGAKAGRPWSMVGTELASTMQNPVFFWGLYRTGMQSTTYLAYLTRLMDAGILPTHAVFPVGSPNDGGVSTANLTEFFNLRSSKQLNTIAWTMLPPGPVSFSASQENGRNTVNASIRAGTYTTGPYEWFEMELPNMTNGATPVAAIPAAYVEPTSPYLHPNNDGDTFMRAAYAAKLTDLKAKYFA